MEPEVSYLIKIPAELWRKFKVKCAEKNVSMISQIRNFIIDFVEGK